MRRLTLTLTEEDPVNNGRHQITEIIDQIEFESAGDPKGLLWWTYEKLNTELSQKIRQFNEQKKRG